MATYRKITTLALLLSLYSTSGLAKPVRISGAKVFFSACTSLLLCQTSLPLRAIANPNILLVKSPRQTAVEAELLQSLKDQIIADRRKFGGRSKYQAKPLPNREFLGLFLASVDDPTLYGLDRIKRVAKEINDSDVNLVAIATWNKSESFIRNPAMAELLNLGTEDILPKDRSNRFQPFAPANELSARLDPSVSTIHWHEWGMRVALAQTTKEANNIKNLAPAFEPVSDGDYIANSGFKVIAQHAGLSRNWANSSKREWKQKTFFKFQNGRRYLQDDYGMIYAHLNFLDPQIRRGIIASLTQSSDQNNLLGVMLDDHFNVISKLASQGKLDSDWVLEQANTLYPSLYSMKEAYRFSPQGKKKIVEFIIDHQMAKLIADINLALKAKNQTLILSPAGWRNDSLLYQASKNLKAPASIQIYHKDQASFSREVNVVEKVNGEGFCSYQSLPIIHNTNWVGSYYHLKSKGCKSVMLFHHQGDLSRLLSKFSIRRY